MDGSPGSTTSVDLEKATRQRIASLVAELSHRRLLELAEVATHMVELEREARRQWERPTRVLTTEEIMWAVTGRARATTTPRRRP